MIESLIQPLVEPYVGAAILEYVVAIIIIVIALAVGKAVNFIVKKIISRIFANRDTKIDDEVINATNKPILVGALLVGIHLAAAELSILAPYMDQINMAFAVIYAVYGGWFAIRMIKTFTEWYHDEIAHKTKSKIDDQFIMIIKKALYGIVGALVLFSILGAFGVSLISLVAVLGIAGLAISLGLKDTISQFFAGVNIMMDRSIKVGDYIELDSGEKGTVVDISWRTTRVRSYKNNMIVLPNNKLANSKVINYHEPVKEVGFTVECGVGYGEDLEKVEKITMDVIKNIMKRHDVFPKGFEPTFRYGEFGDSNINFKVILRTRKYGDQFVVKHEFIKDLKKRFDKEKIEIAWQTVNVHVHK